MSVGMWLAISLPLMAALMAAFGLAKAKPTRLLTKGGAAWVALMTAVVGQETGGNLPAGELIVAAMAVFVLADVLLEVQRVPGILAFAAGHGVLIWWMVEQDLLSWLSAPIAAAILVVAFVLFRKPLKKTGWMSVLFVLYAAVLAAMAGMAAVLPEMGGLDYLPFTVGAVMFVVSDLLVAAGMIANGRKGMGALALILYYAALLLMTMSCWLLF